MIPTTHTLLISVFLLLCGLDEAVPSHCGRLHAEGEGARVKYTDHKDLELDDSETFPPGTLAVTGKVGSKHPDSKHLCVDSTWLRAPWNCEVLLGGCAHNCSSETHTCVCPAGKMLHPNNITCTDGPCELNPCTGEGRECETTRGGGFKCTCKDGFVEEDGVCVNVEICDKCEHMLCNKLYGVYKCECRKGFRVSAHDATKCQVICTERDCPGMCVKDDKQDRYQCFCPDGYIQDVPDANNSRPFCTDINECETKQCDHKCENSFGGYRCLCDKGFKLHGDGYTCEEDEEDNGSGSTPPPYPTPAGSHPAAVPSYIKTGSILGIAVFMALCATLLFFLIRNAVKRCGRFDLSSFKHPDIDIFYLQQVTTETYKRLSFDKFKNDS
ncbi:thrombomodulin-like [Sebastes fasciatus]|uniref:thrombomodulin-like n=1 Tax=Sebastes fasciatus TaxID=394691 RepID=UPI003D9E5D51